MRPPTLQYFYLEKPMTLLILITIVTVFLWIGQGDFYTKGEPREASVAVSMIDDGRWVLPQVYADEFAYKPPLTHWLIAFFSLPSGEVTPFTSRLPSALAFMGLIVFSFIFFGKNLRFQEAFLAALIMLTSFELHRAAMTTRVDMLLTFLIVLGLQRLFRWEERKQLKGFPVIVCIVLGLAVLTKGPIGIVLPLLVFGIYLLLLKYNFLKIVLKLLPIALASLIIPLIWYILAYATAGKEFLDLVWAENFGRFFRIENMNINYELGHDEPFWYNFITLVAGFIPWTILLFLSLFVLDYTKKIPGIKSLWNSFQNQDKIKLFSLVCILVIFIFYCIPSSKRSVYLMPIYPFISIFLAQYILYLTEYKAKISRLFYLLIGIIGCIVAFVTLFSVISHIIDPIEVAGIFTKHQRTLNDVFYTWESLGTPKILYFILFFVLLFSLYVLFKHLRKKNNLKALYAMIGTYFAIFLILDGIYLPAFKDGVSIRPFAENLQENYPLDENNLYTVNNLSEYGNNMYGLNFYLHNAFQNFEMEDPDEGYFIIGSKAFDLFIQKYNPNYRFVLLEEYNNRNRDGEKVIQFYQFRKIK